MEIKEYILYPESKESLISLLKGKFYETVINENPGHKISNSKIRRLLVSGNVFVNDTRIKIPGYVVQRGDRIRIFFDQEKFEFEKSPGDIPFTLENRDVIYMIAHVVLTAGRFGVFCRPCGKYLLPAVNGFAIGGGHVLHVVCDLTIASDNAVFGQTGPRVGSFDAGFGASYLARVVGQKKAREIWFLCRKYNAQEAQEMGLVNKVVPLENLEDEYVAWAEEMMQLSPLALRMIKAGLNAELDGQAGIQELAGDATMLYYLTDEAQEGKNAFLEKRKPDFDQFPKLP